MPLDGFPANPPALPAPGRHKGAGGPRSKTLFHELLLRETFEKYPHSPHKARADACFTALDDILPHLGTFAGIVQLVKEELYRSVFSRGLTSSNAKPYVERLPYFNSFRKLDEIRRAEELKTKAQLHEYEKELRFRENDLKMVYKKNMHLRREIEQLQRLMELKDLKFQELNALVQESDIERDNLQHQHAQVVDALKRKNETLTNSLNQANNFIEKTTSTAHSDTEGTSGKDSKRTSFGLESETEVHEAPMNLQTAITHDHHQCDRIEQQLHELFNALLDDYDITLDQLKKKRALMEDAERNETALAHAEEVEQLKALFAENVQLLLKEQDLLGRHAQGLHLLAASRAAHDPLEMVERKADESYRKFAGVLEVARADRPTVFQPLTGLPFCARCGVHVAFCPHEQHAGVVLALPPAATHVRLANPTLRLRMATRVAGPELSQQAAVGAPASASATAVTPATGGQAEEELEQEHFQPLTPPTFRLIFEDFYVKRGGRKPRVIRHIPLTKLHNLMQEIYVARWVAEEAMDLRDAAEEEESAVGGSQEQERPISFPDFFHAFFLDRYAVPVAAHRVAYNMIWALSRSFAEQNRVWLFSRHLSGEDDVRWRYMFLVQQLLDTFPRMDLPAYRTVVQTIYSARPKEVWDQVELEMTSYSKNRFTKELVEEHFLHMLRNNTDPNYALFLHALQQHDYQDRGSMGCEDFLEAVELILPGLPEAVVRHRYQLAEDHCTPGSVDLPRLAHVGGSLLLYKLYKQAWETADIFSLDFLDAYHQEQADQAPGAVGGEGGEGGALLGVGGPEGTGGDRAGEGLEMDGDPEDPSHHTTQAEATKLLVESQLAEMLHTLDQSPGGRGLEGMPGAAEGYLSSDDDDDIRSLGHSSDEEE